MKVVTQLASSTFSKRKVHTNKDLVQTTLLNSEPVCQIDAVNLLHYEKVKVTDIGVIIDENENVDSRCLPQNLPVEFVLRLPTANAYADETLPKLQRQTVDNKFDYLLVHNHMGTVWGHWIIESLPRLYAATKYRNDFVLLLPDRSFYPANVYETLKPFESRIRGKTYINYKHYIQPKNLFLPSCGVSKNNHPELLREYRDFMLSHFKRKTTNNKFEKVYITRRTDRRRKIVNENEVIALMRELGFTILNFNTLTFQEQVDVCANCKVLVSIHGSALANMLFMAEGSQVMEIRRENDETNNWFYNLANDLKLDYHYFPAKPVDDAVETYYSDVLVDIDKLEKNLKHSIVY